MRSGALFAGYGGLDLAVAAVFGATPAWVAEVEPAPVRILAARFPGVPNLGDVTAVDWATAEPVDVLAGGSPCQDLSDAGKRAGMRPGTRSGLWASMTDAIDIIRPRLVVWENVRGALSAHATTGDLESCGLCLDQREPEPMRALGRVLGDLADLGYDAAWTGVRAADVGAPHGRFRVFVLAWQRGDTAAIPTRLDQHPAPTRPARAGRGGGARGVSLLKTPTSSLGVNGGAQHPDRRRAGGHGPTLADEVEHLLPTPKTTDSKGHSPGDLRRAEPGLRSLPSLLPTPRATDGTKGGPNQRGSSGDLMLPSAVLLPTPKASNNENRQTAGRYGPNLGTALGIAGTGVVERPEFGQYAPAIARWEAVLERPAPAPTEPTGRGGAHRLAPRFVEWLMGLPDGWVTGTDTSRNEQLKALGNGVVPQQAAAALHRLLDIRATAIRQHAA